MNSIEVNSIVRVKRDLGAKTYNRKAIICNFDPLSIWGAYFDRYSIRMIKSKKEIDCTINDIELWEIE